MLETFYYHEMTIYNETYHDQSFNNYCFCSGLTKLIVPPFIGNITNYQFERLTTLQELYVSEGIQVVGQSSFEKDPIRVITLPDTLTEIGANAFPNCNAKSIYIPDSVTSIGESTFSISLNKIYLGRGIANIYQGAFKNCSNLSTVYYGGTEEQWNDIAIRVDNDPLTNANIVYNHQHTWGDPVVIQTATFERTGLQTRTCSECEGVKSENIPRVESAELTQTSIVFDGAIHAPTAVIKDVKGNTLIPEEDYTISYSGTVYHAGNYTVTVTGINRYEFTKSFTFTVKPQPLNEIRVSLDPETVVADGEPHTPEYTVKDAQGRTLTAGTNYNVSVPKGRTDPGIYRYSFSGKENYTGTVEKAFIITEDLNVERVILTPETSVYNGKEQSAVITVTDSTGKTLQNGADYTVTAPEGRKNPGEYVFTLTGKTPYTGSVQKTFTITPHDPHTWDNGAVTTPATCTKDGVKTFTCTYCGDKRTEEIKAVGHQPEKVPAKAATCTTDGNPEYYLCSACKKTFRDAAATTELTETIIPATGHAYGAWTKLDETQHQRVCANDKNHTEKANHTWDSGKVTTEATCTEKGVKTYTCTVCNATKTEEIAANGHSPVTDNAVVATCTADGKTEGSHCSVCNTVIKAQEVVKATGHAYGAWAKLDDTQHQRICANDKTHAEKADHTWDEGKTTTAPTCAATGVKTYTCTVCQATKTETLPKTEDHPWNAGEVTKNATCAESGKKEFVCTLCGAKKTEILPLLETHTWDEGKITASPTCAQTGKKTVTCTVCGATKTELIPMTEPHTWDEGKVTKEPTAEAEGVKTFTCTVCGETKTEPIPKKTPATPTDPTPIDATPTDATPTGATPTDATPTDATPTDAERKSGDVNGDGKIGSDDARLALRRSVGLEDFAEGSQEFLACDVNADGKVGSDDARLILRASVGLEDAATFGKKS